MPWFKVDDSFHSHPKPRRISLAAVGLWTLCGSYCMGYKTDGFVPNWVVAGFPRGKNLAADLVEAGLWHAAEKDGETGHQFHDWLDIQQSSEEIERDREHNRQRQRDFRKRLRDGKKDKGE